MRMINMILSAGAMMAAVLVGGCAHSRTEPIHRDASLVQTFGSLSEVLETLPAEQRTATPETPWNALQNSVVNQWYWERASGHRVRVDVIFDDGIQIADRVFIEATHPDIQAAGMRLVGPSGDSMLLIAGKPEVAPDFSQVARGQSITVEGTLVNLHIGNVAMDGRRPLYVNMRDCKLINATHVVVDAAAQ